MEPWKGMRRGEWKGMRRGEWGMSAKIPKKREALTIFDRVQQREEGRVWWEKTPCSLFHSDGAVF